MKPITITPIFVRIFDAMDIRDRAQAFFLDGSCIPTAHGAGSFQVDVSSGTYVVAGGAYATFAGGNKTPAALANSTFSRCDLIYIDTGGVLQLAAGVEILVTPSTPAIPPPIPANAAAIALAYITPGAVDYGVASSAFVEDIRQMGETLPFRDGTASAPSIRFGATPNTGFSRPAANQVVLAAGSVEVMRWDTNSGWVRIPTAFRYRSRNAGNTADISLIGSDASDVIQIADFGQQVQINGNIVAPVSFMSLGTTPAGQGIIRLKVQTGIYARNNANSADIELIRTDASDQIILNEFGQRAIFNGEVNVAAVGGTFAAGVTPAVAGIIRIPNNAVMQARNAGNTADLRLIGTNASDQFFVAPITTLGDIPVGGAGGIATRLGIGSAGQVLTVSGGTAIWSAPGGGSRDTGSFSDNTTAIAALGTVTKTVTVGAGRILAHTGVTKTAGAATGAGVYATGSTATADAIGIGLGGAVSMRNFDTYLGNAGAGNPFGQGAGNVILQDFWINGTSLTWTFKNGNGANADTLDARAYAVVH